MECAKCGISGSRITFREVITPKGIRNFCERCAYSENFPIVNHATDFVISEPEKKSSVHDRLVRLSGVDVEKRRIAQKQLEAAEKQNVSLRDIVDKNFNKTISQRKADTSNYIDNFHWVLMRSRRNTKLTREQLAKKLGEPESAIKLAEQGIMPDDNFKLARKLEDFLRVSIIKDEINKQIEARRTQLGFDVNEARNLTIADLQEMKKKKQKEQPEEIKYQFTPWENESNFNKELTLENIQELEDTGEELDINVDDVLFNEEGNSEKPEFSRKKDLSDKDINDLIFGKK